jgi:arylsulfatase A-like enzyme
MASKWGKIAISRRTAVAGMVGTAALSALPGCSNKSTLGPIEGKPNFLFIMADDLGYADLSCYGRRDYETPVLDRLASEGMKFMHGYANSAVCTATRVGLISGRYQYRLPIGLQEPGGGTEVGLPPEHPTIASLLRDAGYHSALIGKWHMGLLPKFGPLKSGYDEFWGNRGGGVDYFTHALGGGKDVWDGEVQVEEVGYYTDLLTERSIEFIEARSKEDKPWLLSLHFTAPHWPWEGNNDRGKSESDYIANKQPDGNLDIIHYDGGTMQAYADMMTSLDSNIGRVLEKLTELGMDKDTVVVFTSDNGGERFSDTWPFTGKKTELLEGGIRVPAIVRWPGVTQPGSTSDVPIMSMDWLPTFVAAGGGKTDPAFPPDGVDIMPALKGDTLPERHLFWRFNNKGQEACRLGEWKYLKIAGNEFLFNIVEDPLERGNLKDRNPEKFAELQGEFGQWNATMLYDPNAPSYGFPPSALADHFDPAP